MFEFVTAKHRMLCTAEEQRHTWLQSVAAGRAIGANGLTEPMSSSDTGNKRGRALPSQAGMYYIISGRRSWVIAVPYANL